MVQQTVRQTREMKECADVCVQTRRTVEQTIAYCLQQGGDHAEPGHIQMMRDCIAICDVCMAACDRASDNCQAVCKACVQVAEACAKDCARFKNDEQMQTCAEACRNAAKAAKAVA